MKILKFCTIFLIFFVEINFLAFSLGKKDSQNDDSGTQSNTTKYAKEFIKIDFFLDTKNENPKNHFYWKTKKTLTKDSFDAVSGASKFHSTKKFREFSSTIPVDTNSTLTPGKLLLLPKGLRSLLLFPVSKNNYIIGDFFEAKTENGKITVSFEHRGIKYKIESDENGIISVPKGFFILKTDSEKNPDEKKVGDTTEKSENPEQNTANEESNEKSESEKIEYLPDLPDESLEITYVGKLKANLTENGILTISGKLEAKKKKKEEAPEIPETDAENKTENPDKTVNENNDGNETENASDIPK